MRRTLPSLLCAGALLLGAVACSDDDDTSSVDETSSTTTAAPEGASTLSMPAGDAAIEPGTYLIPSSGWSVADFTVTFPADWNVQYGHVFNKHQDTDEELGFHAVVVDEIFADACEGDGVPMDVGPSVDDLVAALLSEPGPEASDPVDTTLGGLPATRIDLARPGGLRSDDVPLVGGRDRRTQVWYSAPRRQVLRARGPTPPQRLHPRRGRQAPGVPGGSAPHDRGRGRCGAPGGPRLHPDRRLTLPQVPARPGVEADTTNRRLRCTELERWWAP